MTQQAPSSDSWHAYTIADAYKPRPARVYVVGGLLPLPSLTLCFGPPGTMKSLLCMDLAMCVVSGLPWLPPIPGRLDSVQRVTLPAPAVWIDFDNGSETTFERVEAFARERKLPGTAPFTYYTMPSPILNARQGQSVAALIARVNGLGAKLVVIDNLLTASGGADENSAEMGAVMQGLKNVREATGAALVVIHHQTKNGTASRARAGNTIRGHSSIEQSLDLALMVEQREGTESLTVKAAKVRIGPKIPPFGATFAYTHKPGTERELETARFFGMAADDFDSDAAIQREVMTVVKAAADVNRGDLVAAVKRQLPRVGEKRIGAVIDTLVLKRKLTETTGPKNAKLYNLYVAPDPWDAAANA